MLDLVWQTLEASGLGAAARGLTWLYPAANVGHVLGMGLLFVSVGIMDLRVLGLVGGGPIQGTIRRFRPVAATAISCQFVTGLVLFSAEATSIAANPAMQIKALLLLTGLANVLAFEWSFRRAGPNAAAVPGALKFSAALSLLIWFSVAGFGRLAAYL
jgi:hypothetical protein